MTVFAWTFNMDSFTILSPPSNPSVVSFDSGSFIPLAFSQHKHLLSDSSESALDQQVSQDSSKQPVQYLDIFPKFVLRGHSSEVLSVSMSVNGLRACSSSVDCTVRMWDLTIGQTVAVCLGHSDWVWAIDMSDDGWYVASGSKDKSARIWTYDGKLSRVLDHEDEVCCVKLSGDGRSLYTGQGKKIFLWDVASGTRHGELKKHEGIVRGLAINRSNTMLASCSKDCKILLWDLSKLVPIRRLKGHDSIVRGIQFCDGALVSCSNDRSIRVWDILTGQCKGIMLGHEEDIRSVSVSQDGRLAVSCSFDKSIKLWNVDRNSHIGTIRAHQDKIFDLEMTPDARFAISCSWDTTVCVWDLQGVNSIKEQIEFPVYHYEGHQREILSVDICEDCSLAISASSDGLIHIWRCASMELYMELKGARSRANQVKMSSDGKFCAFCGDDLVLSLWNITTGMLLHQMPNDSDVNCLEFLLDQNVLLVGGQQEISVWDLGSGNLLHKKQGHRAAILCMGKSSDMVVSGSQDHDLRTWSWQDQRSANILTGHTRPVRDLTVLNTTIASCSDDKSIRLWDLDTGQSKKIIRSDYADLCCFRFVRNGDFAISFSANSRKIEVWDVTKGQVIAQQEGHSSSITSLSVYPNCRFALTGSLDTTVGRWTLSDLQEFIQSQKEIEHLGLLSNRNMISEDIENDVTVDLAEIRESSEIQKFNSEEKAKRVMVALENENEMLDGIASSSIQGRLGNVIEHILGRKGATSANFELEDDESAWVTKINERYLQEDKVETSPLRQIALVEEDDGGEEFRTKERSRRLSSLALVFGFLLYIPWIAAFFIGGGLRSKDKMTRQDIVSIFL
eukprot:693380-Hanusia_phi.AAC.6